MRGKEALGPFIRGKGANLQAAKKVWQYTGTTHPLNPKYDDIELRRDTEYRVVGVVIEKKKRYR